MLILKSDEYYFPLSKVLDNMDDADMTFFIDHCLTQANFEEQDFWPGPVQELCAGITRGVYTPEEVLSYLKSKDPDTFQHIADQMQRKFALKELGDLPPDVAAAVEIAMKDIRQSIHGSN